MKLFLNKLYLIIIFIFIVFSYGDEIELNIEAKTGIINKAFQGQNIFSFDIECEVNKNISNNITKINIYFKVQKLKAEDNGVKSEFDAICHVETVRVIEENTTTTNLACKINVSKKQLSVDDNLKIIDGPTQESQVDYGANIKMNFQNFEKISEIIKISNLTLNYLDEDEDNCSNNHYLFQIISNIESTPLLSTICAFSLSGDDNHSEANCAIPISGNIIKCFVDVSKKKYVQNNIISIRKQDSMPCENGQIIEIIEPANNNLTIKEECGEIINNNSEYLYFSKLYFLFLLLILF